MSHIITDINEGAGKAKQTEKALRSAMAREKATDKQWQMIGLAVEAFAAKYPVDWRIFVNDQKARKNATEYALAYQGDLKEANYRMTASFPAIIRNGEVVDGLYPVLEKIIPALTHKRSLNFREFLKRYPIFAPSDKISASD